MKPETLNELALFAGAGGGILGGKLRGWRTVCAVEWDAYARDVLVARQNDGCLEAFPIWDDVQTFDGKPWRGRVDVVSGGFPCQDISAAGKGAGIEGERSGMWKHMARIIGEVLPRLVFVENSPMLVGRGLGTVLADLAEMGYDAQWGVVGAHHVAAPHKRDRIWIVANAAGSQNDGIRRDRECGWKPMGRQEQAAQQDHRAPDHHRPCGCGEDVANAMRERSAAGASNPPGRQEGESAKPVNGGDAVGDAESVGRDEKQAADHLEGSQLPCEAGRSGSSDRGGWWATEPNVGRVAHGVAARVDRLRCIGNGQVPAVVPLAWNLSRTTTDEIQ